ncbi:isochorismatase [Ktedonobacter sp. SOSP1-52]|uniref:cysteine hydrolase family protein n=1 Tax=Ktedonobacter sp. SOSP1-52 TaxID=2778366 RepID=UPI001916077F|nr:cysteine hydrolase family protein [Ktedonobacter sp. SOSP1-52]GHO67927.1 isochorismatase [Ktedonobacter sp. SOSP1-52]
MSKQTALIIVDVQVALFKVPGRPTYHEEELLANIAHLLKQARASGTPVIYIQHQEEAPSSLVPGTRGWRIHPSITPLEGETIIPKRSPDAFLATTLDEELQARQITHLVITGCRTDFCIDTTCRAAISHGYDVTLVGDAHSTIDRVVLNAEQIVAHHNATLNGFGSPEHTITVKPTSEVALA